MFFSFSSFLLSLSVSVFSVSVESVDPEPGTNADLTASVDSAEPDLAESEHTVNASHLQEDQEMVNTQYN